MLRTLWFAAPLGTLLVIVLLRARAADDPLDSLIACHATQQRVFENAFVRVIDDVIPPGVAEPKHRHPHGVVVTLADADIETRAFPAGKLVRSHARAGAATWNEPIIHEVKNVGSTPTHFIRIDLK